MGPRKDPTDLHVRNKKMRSVPLGETHGKEAEFMGPRKDPTVLQDPETQKGLMVNTQQRGTMNRTPEERKDPTDRHDADVKQKVVFLASRPNGNHRFVEARGDPTGFQVPNNKLNIRPLMSRQNKEDRSTGPGKDPPDLSVPEIIGERSSHTNRQGIPDGVMEPWKVPIRQCIPTTREGPILFVSLRKKRRHNCGIRAGPKRPANSDKVNRTVFHPLPNIVKTGQTIICRVSVQSRAC
jgi:hypothetical protein